jgi:hypothetical protein
VRQPIATLSCRAAKRRFTFQPPLSIGFAAVFRIGAGRTRPGAYDSPTALLVLRCPLGPPREFATGCHSARQKVCRRSDALPRRSGHVLPAWRERRNLTDGVRMLEREGCSATLLSTPHRLARLGESQRSRRCPPRRSAILIYEPTRRQGASLFNCRGAVYSAGAHDMVAG